MQRVMKRIEQQKAWLKEQDASFAQPIRVRHENIQEFCGVLVGGYPNMETAKGAQPDPRLPR